MEFRWMICNFKYKRVYKYVNVRIGNEFWVFMYGGKCL